MQTRAQQQRLLVRWVAHTGCCWCCCLVWVYLLGPLVWGPVLSLQGYKQKYLMCADVCMCDIYDHSSGWGCGGGAGLPETSHLQGSTWVNHMLLHMRPVTAARHGRVGGECLLHNVCTCATAEQQQGGLVAQPRFQSAVAYSITHQSFTSRCITPSYVCVVAVLSVVLTPLHDSRCMLLHVSCMAQFTACSGGGCDK